MTNVVPPGPAPDVMPVVLRRTYVTGDHVSRAFGVGSTHPYDVFLVGDAGVYSWIDVVLPNGARVRFNRTSPGNGPDGVFEHASTQSPFYKAQITWNGNGWDLKFKNGTLYKFREAFLATLPAQGAAISSRTGLEIR